MRNPDSPGSGTGRGQIDHGLIYPNYTDSELRLLPKDGPRLTLAARDALDAAFLDVLRDRIDALIVKGGQPPEER